MISIPWLAVVCAAVFNFVLGGVWFGVLFTRPWLAAMGITLEDIEDAALSKPRAYAGAFFAAVILAVGMAMLVRRLDLHSPWEGALLGVAGWVTFNFTTYVKLIFFEDRPLSLFWINAGYDVISFAGVGALLAVWR